MMGRFSLVAIMLGISIYTPAICKEVDALEALRQRGYARLALSNEPPWAIVDADGQIGGAGPDLARAVMRRMGIQNVQGTVSSYGAMIPGLLVGRSDIIDSGVFITPARCQAVAYAEPDLCDREAFILKRSMDVHIASFQDVAASPAVSIGVPSGGSEERLARAAGVPNARIIPVPDGPSGMILLETGRISAYALPAISARHLIGLWGERNFAVVEAQDAPTMCAGAAFAPDAISLRDAYDQAFSEVKKSGEYTRILTRYGFDPVLSQQYSREALCMDKAPPQ